MDAETGPIDPSNARQHEGWDGEGGAYWAAHIDHVERGTAAYREAFLAAADADPHDVVLDVGCGAGRTTLDLARRCRSVLGVDLSGGMLALARERAEREGVANAVVEQADARVHAFGPSGVDTVVSKHGSMFFGDPVAAFTNLARALRPGGRLVLLVWQALERQDWLRAVFTAFAAGRPSFAPPPDAPSPVALGDPDRVRAVLAAAGLVDVELTGLHEQMWYGTDVDDAFAFVAGHHGWMLRDLDDAARAGALDALRADLAAHAGSDGVTYDSACWLVTARRP